MVAVAPGTFLVAGLTTDLAKLVREALPPTDAAVTDLSHGRTVLSLEGDAAADVLQSCVTLDLSAFPPGRAAQTAIHHIDVLIHRRSETRFELWALRSFAHALAEWLLDAGLEKGSGSGGTPPGASTVTACRSPAEKFAAERVLFFNDCGSMCAAVDATTRRRDSNPKSRAMNTFRSFLSALRHRRAAMPQTG